MKPGSTSKQPKNCINNIKILNDENIGYLVPKISSESIVLVEDTSKGLQIFLRSIDAS